MNVFNGEPFGGPLEKLRSIYEKYFFRLIIFFPCLIFRANQVVFLVTLTEYFCFISRIFKLPRKCSMVTPGNIVSPKQSFLTASKTRRVWHVLKHALAEKNVTVFDTFRLGKHCCSSMFSAGIRSIWNFGNFLASEVIKKPWKQNFNLFKALKGLGISCNG